MPIIPRYSATVIGAGPAGLAVVATLLDAGADSILWADPAFEAGRLSSYKEVPSNTKVELFSQYASVSPTLSSVSTSALRPLQEMDPEKGCTLVHASNMVSELSAAIQQKYQHLVRCHKGLVSTLQQDQAGHWHIDNLAVSKEVYICTGSHPKRQQLHPLTGNKSPSPRVLDLDDMLTPSRIPGLVTSGDVVGVVGSSHSAVLVLRNILEAANPPSKVLNLYRSPLLYAEYMDGWIKYDNTGLKGLAADWAREKLETGWYERTGKLERICVKENTEAVTDQYLSTCSAVVHAIGFDLNPTPTVFPYGYEAPLQRLVHDVKTGIIKDTNGLRGFGIAFPEQVTDPTGRTEYAVGQLGHMKQKWNFMFIKIDVASSLIPGLLSKKNDTSKPKTFNVPTIDLALWISKNVDPKDFVHVRMDIEGAEYMVLRRLIVTGVACKYFNVLEVEFHALHTKSNYAMRPADVVLPWILRGCGMKVLHAAYYPKELYDMTGDSPCNECELLKTILPNTPGGQGEKLVNEAYP
ncbi:hypothetical protein CEUSTIGMA_g11489.t1 [Chlamydomonas eustigma]|uniref:Methyltransferase FkbM domain-containing protein n=1 Tax=Chlamydomonas eustigma TaxID=1157962 RepID=A0A250XLT8_9CHLO|nr:hypothetical protein CEUSTIGMA_g11489.t1 [Chlamydomonas eustigma]|eukprot:GAX84065.1 hypothetical protein CEUSTIGMA_g11489.t1 [Chlamydomonas eustigma]